MPTKSLLLFALCGCIFLQSCATIFSGTGSTVKISNGTPANAKIYVDGNLVGNASKRVKLPKSALRKGQTITIKADGYKDANIQVRRKAQVGFVVLDIFLGVWPLGLDFLTGAIYKASPKTVNFDLDKQN